MNHPRVSPELELSLNYLSSKTCCPNRFPKSTLHRREQGLDPPPNAITLLLPPTIITQLPKLPHSLTSSKMAPFSRSVLLGRNYNLNSGLVNLIGVICLISIKLLDLLSLILKILNCFYSAFNLVASDLSVYHVEFVIVHYYLDLEEF
uniref:SSO3024-like protein n=1 Tax=Saccharolobus solfataricus (strain 98/2) TaxID=555311 RepID=G8GCU1_SACS9|nr:SSO3024-like protein [Saccharolobus solfataricus 98/2]